MQIAHRSTTSRGNEEDRSVFVNTKTAAVCLNSPFSLHPVSTMRLLVSLLLFAVLSPPAAGMDRVTFRRDEKLREVTGRLLVTAKDGGLLLLGRDGVLWAIPPNEKVEHTSDKKPFVAYSRDEISKRLLQQLPTGFRVRPTAHYLIFYDTSPAYAQWCGALFEQLYGTFTVFWTRKGIELEQPEFPLVAIVFADKASYEKFTRPDLGEAASSIIGYYALMTNRMMMYDLTGVGGQEQGSAGNRTAAEINKILAQPEASRTVATIIHEATHQLAFNCGLQTRLADCPLWFSEGIAVYFETPDLRSSKGWRGVGRDVNPPRLERFRQYLANRSPNSLERLICDDSRFRDPKQSYDAYAEAWALTYYLIRNHAKQYVEYAATQSKKKPLIQDTPKERLEDFSSVFGELRAVDAEFLRSMARLR
jgi:hypothetical protein